MPRPSLSTRKPIARLTPEDFATFPIWEFAIDEEGVAGRDETWVRPVEGRVIERGMWSLSVAADFWTASGVQLDGFAGISTAGKVELEPVVLLEDGKYLFVAPEDRAERARLAAALRISETDLFPLRFRLRVLVRGERTMREGVIR